MKNNQKSNRLRARAVESLTESEELMRFIVRHDPNAIAIFDAQLHYIAVSERYLADYGVKEEAIIGKHHYQVFPELPDKWKQVHQRSLAGAVESSEDDSFERPDGSITFTRWECRPWRRADGQIGGIITYTEVTTDRKKAERALLDSEIKYRYFFENSMDAILLTSPDGSTHSANQAACTMFGYSEDELIELGRAGIADDTDGRLSDLLTERKSKGKAQGVVTFIRKDGTRFPAEISTSRFQNNEGLERSSMIIRDITERKKIQNELKFQADLLENVGQAVIATDLQSKVTYWNKEAERIYGWSAFEAIGQNSLDLVTIKATPQQQEELKQRILQGTTWSGEIPVKKKDGSIFPAYFTYAPVLDSNKDLIGVVRVSLDLTERKKEEEKLLKLSSAVEQTMDTIVITDRHGTIEYVNPAFETLTGYSSGEVLGKTPRILKSGFKDQQYYETMWKTILSGNVFVGEVANKKKNGELFYEQKTISPILDKKGIITHFVGTGVDISERKRTEKALHESEELYRSLFENMLNGFAYCKMIFDKEESPQDFVYLAVNQSFERLTGLQNVAGKMISEVIPGIRISDPGLFEIYGRVALTGQPEIVEFYLEGLKMWFSSAVYSPQKGYNVAVFDVITERKRAEKALRKSEAHFKTIFNEAPLGIALVDSFTGHVYSVNPMFAKITGRTVDEMTNIDWMSITHPDDLQEDLDNMALMNTGKISGYQMEKRYLHPDGIPVWMKMTISPIYAEDKEHPCHLCMIEDITDRKRAEEKLIIANKELVFQNEEKEKRASELVIANNELAFQTEEKGKRADELIIANKELVIQNKEKEKRASELEIANQELVFQNDEKEKRAAELIIAKEKAEESDRLKSAFLANMSHEVRTPLNSIIGFSELLADPDFEEEYKQEFISHIVTNGNQLLRIISDIMDISKMESGEITIRKNQLDLGQFMVAIAEQSSFQAAAKNLELQLILPDTEDETLLVTDADRLNQVFNNLISNALKFTANGQIAIGFHPYDTLIEFYVSDTGIGIPEKYHDQIFERFRQVEGAHTRTYGGNGLGLAISKNLVELMGGKIWVESEPGKGSTFYFTIPK